MDKATAITVLGLRHDYEGRRGLVRAWHSFARENHPDLRPQDPWAAMRLRTGRAAYEALLNELPPEPAAPAVAPPAPFVAGIPVAQGREWRA